MTDDQPRKRRKAGHSRIATKPDHGRGWNIRCACGWNGGWVARRGEAWAAYSDHFGTAPPLCAGCGKEADEGRLLKYRSSQCAECSYARARNWKADKPKRWEASARASHLRRMYGITVETYEAMLRRQGHKCAICRTTDLRDTRGFRPHVDHCHRTGRVRGILCRSCNKGIGLLRDNPAIVQRAAAYLRRNPDRVAIGPDLFGGGQ